MEGALQGSGGDIRGAIDEVLGESGREVLRDAFEGAFRGERQGSKRNERGARRSKSEGGAKGVWRENNAVRFSHFEEPEGQDNEIHGNDIVASHGTGLTMERSRFMDNQIRGGHMSGLSLEDSAFIDC